MARLSPASDVEVILKDDAANPDSTKRLAQELVVNDKVNILAGFGLTPACTCDRTDRNGSQGARDRHGGGHVDHHRALGPISCARASGPAILRHRRRLGG